jgi:2-iminobutanoate/2-iminopropanoate deaminase
MERRTRVETPLAPGPTADAPYSQAIAFGDLVFASGQLPVVAATGRPTDGGIEAQTEQVMLNLEAVLKAAGSNLDQLLKTTVYLRTRDDWEAMNNVYRKFVGRCPPARTAVEVGRLAHGALIELDAIAFRDEAKLPG